jgi:osmotically-inducible protein OsmY
MRRPPGASALVVLLTGVLSGCAVYRSYEKCGFHGCADDPKITAAVLSRFNQRLDLEPQAITVQTLDRVVYLQGLVSSGLEIDTAESIARQVPGVRRVVSSIAVSNPVW